MAKDGRPFTLLLDDELRAEAEALAKKQGQDLDELILEAIRLALARGSTR